MWFNLHQFTVAQGLAWFAYLYGPSQLHVKNFRYCVNFDSFCHHEFSWNWKFNPLNFGYRGIYGCENGVSLFKQDLLMFDHYYKEVSRLSILIVMFLTCQLSSRII